MRASRSTASRGTSRRHCPTASSYTAPTNSLSAWSTSAGHCRRSWPRPFVCAPARADPESTMPDPIPFLDLEIQHEPLRAQFLGRFGAVIDGHGFAGGPTVDAFEREWADYCRVTHAVGVSNGTDAIEIALRALELPAGSGVV